ncbi:single-stranded-DNA-specific exonuclease RecJ [Candidatus Adlerbacteria bacterium RIFOXYB1_FULL_48_10]|nr:MAG: single-stranded-DNA-specific exonuclease RecJ [Candidatus Adlerbacteria bacterium RIFOXYB1_FULL_48_10]
MEKAVERVLRAREQKEIVVVWSDYDADGLPAGVMLTQFLRDIGLNVIHHIPHRNNEGFGLNKKGIEDLSKQGVKLMITADCGTTDAEQIAFANEKGIDTIVTDHHVAPPELPPAFAVINPKRLDSTYPFDGLCGAGVAWKLVQGILKKNRPEGYADGREKWFLDLVGIATLSDMVPLVDENRMLAHFGLTVMRRARRPGLSALLKLLKIKPATLTEDDVGFMISPRINAASRMGNPLTAARLLAAEGEEAVELARELQALNDERKTVVATTVKEANKRLAEQAVPSSVIVMGSPNWRPGILGLVASSLVETHQKPVFLWGREGGEELKGSCRSDGVANVVDCMRLAHAEDLFVDFGGHHGAGGFSLTQERVHELHTRLERAYESLRSEISAAVEVQIDRELELAELPHALKGVQRLAPFGVGHIKPLFILPNVTISNIKLFGKTQNHLGLTLVKDRARTEGIAFFSTAESFQKPIVKDMKADIVGHVELDWRGQPRVRIVDIL